MKKIAVFFFSLFFGGSLVFAQEAPTGKEPKAAVSIGVLQGGGSLFGADFELLVTNRFGFQVGAGLVGLGAGLNYHLKPSISSSTISMIYWHQGLGDTYTQSLFGPSYIFRAKRFFTASLGLGYALEQGPGWPIDKMEQPPVMLTYSIGMYIPVK
jgi:hypothetical protein